MAHRLSNILSRYTVASSGSVLYSPTNYTITDENINSHLEGIDAKLVNPSALNVEYDPSISNLNSTNVKQALDEIVSLIPEPFTNPVNYSPTDTNNISSHFQAIDVALASAGGSFYRTNRENIAVNKQLQTDDPNLQILKNESGGAVTVNLPTSPVKDSYFLIASRKDSIGPINVNTITLSPGDRLELIYDGTEWFLL